MGEIDRRRLAARNNAEWCETVSAAHGVGGRYSGVAWVQPRPGPPFYPNLVTLTAGGVTEQLAAIGELKRLLGPGFAVKDSFAALDLAPLGFRLLFEATWISLDKGRGDAGEARWQKVAGVAELAEWEAMWRACGSPTAGRVFPPVLLAEERVAFLAAWEAGRIVAGCIANRSAEVVGLSNFFAEASAVDHRRSAIAAAAGFAGDRIVVGYESGRALRAALGLGFVATGPLRVWLFEGERDPAAGRSSI